MSVNTFKESLQDIPLKANDTLNSNIEYYKLFAFRFIAKVAYGLLNIFILGMIMLLVLFFVSFAVAYAVGEWLGSNALGFLSVGLLYFLLAIVAYFFKKSFIEKPLLSKLSENYFKSDEDDDNQE